MSEPFSCSRTVTICRRLALTLVTCFICSFTTQKQIEVKLNTGRVRGSGLFLSRPTEPGTFPLGTVLGRGVTSEDCCKLWGGGGIWNVSHSEKERNLTVLIIDHHWERCQIYTNNAQTHHSHTHSVAERSVWTLIQVSQASTNPESRG